MIRTDMNLFHDLQLKLERQCKCSRTTDMIHCPTCGSTDVRVAKRASKNRMVLLPDGSETAVRVFGCRRCAIVFPENMCFFTCVAPPLNWRKEENVAERVAPLTTHLTPTMRTTLEELARLRPDKAKTIAQRLHDDGPGLLERIDMNKDNETAKLFEPPKLDEGGES